MLHHLFKSPGRAALRMAGGAGLALLFLLNVSWSLLPHRKPHPADMTLRATAVGPLLHASPRHPAAVAQASPQPTPQPTPLPTPLPKLARDQKPPRMTLRATAVFPAVLARPKHPAVAQIPAPAPEPLPKPKPAVVAAIVQKSPQPSPPPPAPRRKHKPADMTLRATAVGPLLPVRSKRPAIAAAAEDTSAHAEPSPTPEPEPTPPAAEEIRRIGVVKVIGARGTFLLIEARDTDLIAGIPNGTELRCRGSAETGGAQTALLRVSPERRAPFIVADIVSGSPQVGDGVYLPDAASPPR